MPEKQAKTTASVNAQLNEETTYRIGNRSFVIEPVFKGEGENTLGCVLLRLMKYESVGI